MKYIDLLRHFNSLVVLYLPSLKTESAFLEYGLVFLTTTEVEYLAVE